MEAANKQHEASRLRHERDQLAAESQWLHQQLKEKSEALQQQLRSGADRVGQVKVLGTWCYCVAASGSGVEQHAEGVSQRRCSCTSAYAQTDCWRFSWASGVLHGRLSYTLCAVPFP